MAQLRKNSKWNNKPLSFASRATSFVKKAIAVRRTIIRLNKSKKSNNEVTTALLYLSAWFAQPLSSAHAATLIFRHYDKVMILLPGRDAKNFESMLQEFQHLVNEAVEILEKQATPQLQQASL